MSFSPDEVNKKVWGKLNKVVVPLMKSQVHWEVEDHFDGLHFELYMTGAKRVLHDKIGHDVGRHPYWLPRGIPQWRTA